MITIRRIIAFLLMVCLMLTLIPCSMSYVSAESNSIDTAEYADTESLEIFEGEIVQGHFKESRKEMLYVFTPTETGYYALSYESIYDQGAAFYPVTAGIKDQTNELINSSYYEDSFELVQYLEAENVYTIELYPLSADFSYEIIMEKCVTAEAVNIKYDDAIVGREGLTHELYIEFSPYNAAPQNITWVSDDEAIAKVEAVDSDKGKVTFVSGGSTTITAISEMGLKDTINVTVESKDDFPVLELNAVLTVPREDLKYKKLLKFTPEESGEYVFWALDYMNLNAVLYDETFGELCSEKTSSDGYIVCELNAGETYYYAVKDTYPYTSGTVSFQVIKYLPVTSLEVISLPTKTDYYKGEINTIYIDGLELKANLEDGSVAYWSAGDNYLAGHVVDVFWEDDEETNSEITVWVECDEQKTSFTLNVLSNRVSSIEIISGDPPVLTEGVDIVNTGSYYQYRTSAFSQIVFRVNYVDGTSKTGRIGDELDEGYYITSLGNQSDVEWHCGNDNYLTVEYMGITVDVPFTILENPVEQIVLNTAPTKDYVWGDPEYGVIRDGTYKLTGNFDFTGLSITVYFKDGTTQTYSDENTNWDNYKMGDYKFSISWRGHYLNVGDTATITISYLGHSVSYETDIVSAPEIIAGDVNEDGKVSLLDVILLRKHIASSDVVINEAAADLNGDGQLKLIDVILLRKALVS